MDVGFWTCRRVYPISSQVDSFDDITSVDLNEQNLGLLAILVDDGLFEEAYLFYRFSSVIVDKLALQHLSHKISLNCLGLVGYLQICLATKFQFNPAVTYVQVTIRSSAWQRQIV